MGVRGHLFSSSMKILCAEASHRDAKSERPVRFRRGLSGDGSRGCAMTTAGSTIASSLYSPHSSGARFIRGTADFAKFFHRLTCAALARRVAEVSEPSYHLSRKLAGGSLWQFQRNWACIGIAGAQQNDGGFVSVAFLAVRGIVDRGRHIARNALS